MERRTIKLIYNNDTAKTIEVDSLFSLIENHDMYVLLRKEIWKRNDIGNPLYVCDECGTELELSCLKKRHENNHSDKFHTYFFKHKKEPEQNKCSIKTNTGLTKEEILKKQYLFKKESNLHKSLKQKVGDIIREYIDKKVVVDSKFINDKYGDTEKRKPDIFFKYDLKEITIEFQVNNTFHSIVRERENFYERNKISLIWVFAEFNPDEFHAILQKDIYIPNKNNAFVFDFDAENESHQKETLCLRVYYKKYFNNKGEIGSRWEHSVIPIDDLDYDNNTLRPYYIDDTKSRNDVEFEILDNVAQANLKSLQQKVINIKSMLKEFRYYDDYDATYLSNYLDTFNNDDEIKFIRKNIDILKPIKNSKKNYLNILIEEGGHNKLVCFLLSNEIIISELNGLNMDSLLISRMEHYEGLFITPDDEIVQRLFLKGYKMSEKDVDYILSRPLTNNEEFKFILESYQSLNSISELEYFYRNKSVFFVIESLIRGKLFCIGSPLHNIKWLIELSINKYQTHWNYIYKAYLHHKRDKELEFIVSEKKYNDLVKKVNKIKKTENIAIMDRIAFKLYPEIFG